MGTIFSIAMFSGISTNTLWLILFVLFLIFEAVTVSITSIWFAAGALVALICSMLGGPVWLQVVLFFLVSILTLILTKPLVKKFVNSNTVSTNFDRIIGMNAVVTEEINNLKAQGAVLVDGKVWTARSSDDSVIEKDTIVKVCKIDGVKLIVSKIN